MVSFIKRLLESYCLLIAGSTYYPESKEQLKLAEQSGKEVLTPGKYEVIKAPEHLSKEQFENRYSWKVDGQPEDKKEQLYTKYEQEVRNKEAEFNFKKERSQKAFIVASDYGQKAGEIIDVYVPQPEPKAIAQEKDIEEKIAEL